MAGRAAVADDVGVAVDARARLGVVVVELERVRLGLLQEVDDVAILVRALGEAILLGLAFERRFPAALLRRRLRRCRRAGPRTLRRAEHERRLAFGAVHEADADPAVRFGDDLRRHGEADDLVARGQHDLVAAYAERPVEHDRLAVDVVALLVLVGLDDDEASLAIRRHGASERHLDVIGVEVGVGHQRILACVGAAHDLEVQRLAGHGVEHGLVARGAALADGVVEGPRAGGGGGDLVGDPELAAVGREQFVARVLVRFGLGRSGRQVDAVCGRRGG